jgi:peptidoglycan/xylan/chitin deacetylase (PgdA/CDA1 family)
MLPKLRLTTSWDDGHPLDLRIAELLAKYGLRGTFYVPLENSRPTLSAEQIRDLSSGFEIGAHTVHHSILTDLSNDAARAEIAGSKEYIEEITGKPCATFCFPSGRFGTAHIHMLAEAGFTAARTVELLSLERPYTKWGISMIPTTAQAHRQPTRSYLRNAVKRFRLKTLWSFLVHDNHGTDWAAMAISLLRRAKESGGVFHLWGHSWEIEENQQWPALERVLAAMAEASQFAPCATNAELCFNGQ